MNIENIIKNCNFSEAEKELIYGAKTNNTADINQSRILSELILSKRIESATSDLHGAITVLRELISRTGGNINKTMGDSTDKLFDSINSLKDEIQEYSKASNKHASAIKWLTGGLVFVGLINVIITYLVLKN